MSRYSLPQMQMLMQPLNPLHSIPRDSMHMLGRFGSMREMLVLESMR
jgi:hypothetical protein